MPEHKILIIDIGTNSVLALLANVEDGCLSVITDKKQTAKLGEGLMSSGLLSREAMSRTADAIMKFIENSDCENILLIGTEALRIAKNSDDFTRMIYEMTKLRLAVIPGELEAELSFLGATYNLKNVPADILLIDVGGGSTELVRAKNKAIKIVRSVPLGALKLKELSRIDSLDGYMSLARRAFMNNLKDLEIHSDTTVMATGGTITSLAAIFKNQIEYNPNTIHGVTLPVPDIEKIAASFQTDNRENKRNLIPFDPERADIILPGAGIYLAIMGILNKHELIVSTGGLRFGAALNPEKITT